MAGGRRAEGRTQTAEGRGQKAPHVSFRAVLNLIQERNLLSPFLGPKP